MLLFEKVAKQAGRALRTWSAARGLRVTHGLKLKLLDFGKSAPPDSNDTKQLPDALAQVQRMKEPTILLFLDVHLYLSNPIITRAMRELALQSEAKRLQLALVGHDIELPEELSPYASRFEVEPVTIERVKALFSDETARRRTGAGRGSRRLPCRARFLLAP